MVLIGTFMLTSINPANAQTNKDTNNPKIVYTDSNGNKVIVATKDNGEKGYVIVAKEIVFNDLSDEKKVKELAANSADGEVVGERNYFAFSDNLKDATDLAKKNVKPDETKYSIQTAYYFWGNGSYIDTGWNSTDGNHSRLHLASNDVNWISGTVVDFAAISLGYALGTNKVTKLRAGAIAGSAVFIIKTAIWSAQNADGSIDMFHPDADSNDHNPIYGGDFTGKDRFLINMGVYFYIYWQYGWNPISL